MAKGVYILATNPTNMLWGEQRAVRDISSDATSPAIYCRVSGYAESNLYRLDDVYWITGTRVSTMRISISVLSKAHRAQQGTRGD